MVRENIDVENLQVTGKSPQPGTLRIEDAVTVVVNQAFGPTGESLIGVSQERFDGYPAVTLLVRAGELEELVHLSPIHGDRRKRGLESLAEGTKCELLCPLSRTPLDKVRSVIEGSNAEYFAIYLTPKLDKGSTIYISDVWGHHHSRIIDNHELISMWAAAEESA